MCVYVCVCVCVCVSSLFLSPSQSVFSSIVLSRDLFISLLCLSNCNRRMVLFFPVRNIACPLFFWGPNSVDLWHDLSRFWKKINLIEVHFSLAERDKYATDAEQTCGERERERSRDRYIERERHIETPRDREWEFRERERERCEREMRKMRERERQTDREI